MKIISLNAWEGKVDIIQDFLKKELINTDIFCFQESLNDKSEIFCKNVLEKYQSFYDQKVINNFNKYNQSTFIKPNLEVVDSQTIGENDPDIGFGLVTKIKTSSGIINICNFHGVTWSGDDKKDNPNRLRQSQTIIDFFKNLNGSKIICGDFNIDLDTKSVSLFEENGYKNLLKEFNISTTRNHFVWDKFPESKQLFADQFFVSPDLKINNFIVPKIDVSDHLPMVLEYEF